MLNSKTRKMWTSGRVDKAFRPTDGTHTAYVLPSAPYSADAYSSAVLADSPVFYFKGDEASGNLVDKTGNGYIGTANGGSITYGASTGRAGLPTGFQLPGSSSGYFTIADAAALDITGDLTYECWFRFASNPAASSCLMTKGFSGGNGTYEVLQLSTGALKVNQNGVGQAMAAGTALSTGVLHHVVLTRVGTALTLYVDGASYNTSSSGFTPSDSTQVFGIGVNFQSGSGLEYCAGIFAGVAIYNTALSSSRVTAHYNAGV